MNVSQGLKHISSNELVRNWLNLWHWREDNVRFFEAIRTFSRCEINEDVKSMKMHQKSIIPKNCGRSDPHLSRFAPYKLIPFSYTSFCFEIDVAYAITVVGKQWNLTRCLMKKLMNKRALLETSVEHYSLPCEST